MSEPRKEKDERIIRRVLAGHREDFTLLVERHFNVVQAVVFSRLGNQPDAEDAVQETFLKAFQSLDTLRDKRKFLPWLIAIAKNVSINLVTSSTRAHSTRTLELTMQGDTQHRAERKELHELLHHRLTGLDENSKEILMLYYFAGKSTREISRVLGISTSAVKKRLQRAREALGKSLASAIGSTYADLRCTKNRAKRIGAVIAMRPADWESASAAGILAVAGASKPVMLLAVALVAVGGITLWYGYGRMKAINHDEHSSVEKAGTLDSSNAPINTEKPDANESLQATRIGSAQITSFQVHGQVTDILGNPIEGATVTFFPMEPPITKVSAWSDSEGAFGMNGLEENTSYYARAFHEAFASMTQERVEVRTAPLTFALKRRPSIKGRVIDADTKRPVSLFRVGIRAFKIPGVSQPQQPLLGDEFITFDDLEGRFTLNALRGSGVTLVAHAAGYSPNSVDVLLPEPGQSVSDILIQLKCSPIIEGIVLNENAEPLAGTLLFLGSIAVGSAVNRDELRKVAVGETDSQGRFILNSFVKMPAGIGAYHPGYAPTFAAIPRGQISPSTLRVVLTQGGILQGRISLEGRPLANQRVELVQDNTDYRARANAYSDENGHYSFSNLPPGAGTVTWHFSTVKPHHRVTKSAIVDPNRLTTVNFDMPQRPDFSCVLEGLITMNGEPVKHASVSIVVDTGYGESMLVLYLSVYNDGWFVAGPIPAGRVTIEVSTPRSPGHKQLSKRVELELRADRTARKDFHFEYEGGKNFIEGRILGLDEGMNAVVSVLSGSDWPPRYLSEFYERIITSRLSANREGEVRLDGLTPGFYTVYAEEVPVLVGPRSLGPSTASPLLSPTTIMSLQAPQFGIPARRPEIYRVTGPRQEYPFVLPRRYDVQVVELSHDTPGVELTLNLN